MLRHGKYVAGGTIANARFPVGKARVGRTENHARGGSPPQFVTVTHGSCDCNDTDISHVLRLREQYASFVNKEVAAWIENSPALGSRKRYYLPAGLRRSIKEPTSST